MRENVIRVTELFIMCCTIAILAILRYYRPWTRPDGNTPLKFERKIIFLGDTRNVLLLTPNDQRHAVNHSANNVVWVIHSRVKRFKSVPQSSTVKFTEIAPKIEHASFCFCSSSI